MKITAILSVDRNWGIGYRGQLLYRISADLKRFRALTTNNIVIMGSKTFLSLNQKPLPNRINIVLSRTETFQSVKDLYFCKNIDDVFAKAKNYPDKELFIIGGQSIYEQFLPYCSDILLTKIHHETVADAYFPNIDIQAEWHPVEISPIQTVQEISFTYWHYQRKKS
ncbi:MAG: dihydrofolate reductase [Treponemataceae bacterium]